MASKYMKKIASDFGILASALKSKETIIQPSRSPSLNWATDTGGFVAGKINILYGIEQSGKSLLAMMAIADYQKRDPEAEFIWFDAELSFNVKLFEKIGGDLDRLLVRRSNDPVKIFDFIGGELLEALQDGAPIRGIVIDSIKAIRYPKESNMKLTTDQKMGGTGASYLPSALKLVIPVIAEYDLLTFFIQQVTMELDPMKALRNPYVLTEGRALKHAGDLMLEITKLDTKNGILESGETISGASQQVGHKVRVKVKKNRLGRPARMAEFMYHYDHGIINTDEEIFELGKSLGVIYHPVNPETGKVNPQMWTVGNHPPVRGEANMKNMVLGSAELRNEILTACYKHEDSSVQLDGDGTVVDLNLDGVFDE